MRSNFLQSSGSNEEAFPGETTKLEEMPEMRSKTNGNGRGTVQARDIKGTYNI